MMKGLIVSLKVYNPKLSCSRLSRRISLSSRSIYALADSMMILS